MFGLHLKHPFLHKAALKGVAVMGWEGLRKERRSDTHRRTTISFVLPKMKQITKIHEKQERGQEDILSAAKLHLNSKL